MNKQFSESLNKIMAYCESEKFKGYDPYDSLNSRFFQAIPLLSKNRIARLIWTQFFKRSPLNLRRFVGVKKEYNPKAMGLFLSAYCQLYKVEPKQEYLNRIDFFIEQIKSSVNKTYSGASWGYNFNWQARAFFQPKNTPTVVASSFIANGLLDAYEIIMDNQLINMARSTCDFVLKDLNRTYDDKNNFAFSYSPLDKSVVFNASLLGSRLLSRVYSFTLEKELVEAAKKSVTYCCDHQRADGSWNYGNLPYHQWIDNFHTGYNLECISDYMKFSGDDIYIKNLNQGFEYYIHAFFTKEGVPKYYNNSTYPIDIHAPAQMVITLAKLGRFQEEKELMDSVLSWTIKNMQSKKGFFYYQINKFFSSKIPYIRWAQAWMFYALATYKKTDNYE